MRLVIAAALAFAAPAAAQVVTVPPLAAGEVLLEVNAQGRVRTPPDRVGLAGGVVTTGGTAREALDANAAAMARVIAALKAAGARDADIQTRQLSVNPRFQRNRESYDEQPRITGYVAQNSVAVATNRLALAPRLIEAMFAAGANNVSGPRFTIENDRAALAGARREAVARAREQADAYAAAFGLRVARVLHVAERGSSVQPVDIIVMGSRMSSFAVAEAPPPPAAPIEAGQLDQSVSVQVQFALTPR